VIGQATIVKAALPAIVYGKIIDASGNPLANASVDVHQPGQLDRRVTANAAGEYAFTIFPTERCDLFVTTGKLSAYRFGFQPTGELQQRLDWTLAETQGATAGAGSSRREEALTAKSETRNPKSEIDQSLLTSAATNGVLQLDGKASYVELPSEIFTGLPEATVECWVKW